MERVSPHFSFHSKIRLGAVPKLACHAIRSVITLDGWQGLGHGPNVAIFVIKKGHVGQGNARRLVQACNVSHLGAVGNFHAILKTVRQARGIGIVINGHVTHANTSPFRFVRFGSDSRLDIYSLVAESLNVRQGIIAVVRTVVAGNSSGRQQRQRTMVIARETRIQEKQKAYQYTILRKHEERNVVERHKPLLCIFILHTLSTHAPGNMRMGDPPLIRIMPAVVVWDSFLILSDKRDLLLAGTSRGVLDSWYISGCQIV